MELLDKEKPFDWGVSSKGAMAVTAASRHAYSAGGPLRVKTIVRCQLKGRIIPGRGGEDKEREAELSARDERNAALEAVRRAWW